MMKSLSLAAAVVIAAGLVIPATAEQEKANQPDTRFVEETLKALGGEHFPEGLRIVKVNSIPVGGTFYHVYKGTLNRDSYHVIVFDNQQKYRGFYKTSAPPTNYQRKECIVLDTGVADESGDPLLWPIPLTEKRGPPKSITVGGVPTKLVTPPMSEEEMQQEGGGGTNQLGEATGNDKAEVAEYEFREWTITLQNKPLTVRALYISQDFGTVTLKGEGTGNIREFSKSRLSQPDRDYLKQYE